MCPVKLINGRWVLTRDPTLDDQQQQQHYVVGPGLVGSFNGPAPRAFSRRKYRHWAQGELNKSWQPFVWDSRTGTPTLLFLPLFFSCSGFLLKPSHSDLLTPFFILLSPASQLY